MKFTKVLIIGIDEAKLGSAYWDRINALTDKKVYLPKDSPEIKENLKDTDCLLVNFGITVTRTDIDVAPNLKYIGILATAFGKVDVEYANSKGIVVCNLPGYSSESVAEFIIAAILETIRHLEEGKERGRTGNVSEEGISAIEVKDKVFGIIGLGNIGTRVGEIAFGFGAKVKYWSRHKKDVQNVTYQELDDLISEADFLSLNLAQTPETEKILDMKRFQLFKPGAVVVNTAPMELVDIDGLIERLKKDDITFILDHSDEMSEQDLNKLLPFTNCIVYPPIAYVSKEAGVSKQEMFTSNIENFVKETPKNTVKIS